MMTGSVAMLDELLSELKHQVAANPANRFPGGMGCYFAEPLVGFALATDQLFTDYKSVIGDFHLTPRELAQSAGWGEVRPRTVVVWVLPIALDTRKANRRQSSHPSKEWALTREEGEKFNDELRRHIVDWLKSRGHRALAPILEPGFKTLGTPSGPASTWSERHAAYAAGLGTFSLNDALITPVGIAHRLGSVVTDLEFPPSPRAYADYRENCLYFREGTCGKCIERCPAGALTRAGHDKKKCKEWVYGEVPKMVGESFGLTQLGCGLCQTAVPCEACIPMGKRA